MQKTKLNLLLKEGQSIWLDNINRFMLESGKLKTLIDKGLRGMTSNPSIFDKAISSGNDYDEKIQELSKSDKTIFQIYDDLTVKDIQDAADIFKPVYEETKGLDGYISLEINPNLAYDFKTTVEEGKRLHKKVARPNLMLKVPATDEGFQAIENLISCGINVNATLIFSLDQYINTANAYIRGIKCLLNKGEDISNIRSVASIFVSRIDTLVDKLLDENPEPKAKLLKGKAAVANSSVIYSKYFEIFESEEFKNLTEKGANRQRVLWGSTSTKNPNYSDIKYIEELVADNTVNTIPEDTLNLFLDHGRIKKVLDNNIKESEEILNNLKEFDIDIKDICKKLLYDGVEAFIKSFNSLLESIDTKSNKFSKTRR